MFYEIVALKTFAKFTEKHLFQSMLQLWFPAFVHSFERPLVLPFVILHFPKTQEKLRKSTGLIQWTSQT